MSVLVQKILCTQMRVATDYNYKLQKEAELKLRINKQEE